jgi:hypothetical protein
MFRKIFFNHMTGLMDFMKLELNLKVIFTGYFVVLTRAI